MENGYCMGCMEHLSPDVSRCEKCHFDEESYIVEPHHLKPGTELRNRYIVGRVLGEGGFGITYVGRDAVLDMKVAVKEFYMSGYVNRNNTYSTFVGASVGTHAQTFEKNREKFLEEARVLAKFCDEPGIVGIRDYFEENNTAYLVMDFLEGETLQKRLETVGVLTPQETLDTLYPVLSSLSRVHEKSIVHRDISPDNIMLTVGGGVKLLDFGAARSVSQNDIKSRSVILKPGYAPEEQYRSKGQQGPWTDIYALSATMYRCIGGIVPDDAMERMYCDNLAPLSSISACPPVLSDVIMKGLSIRLENRYANIPDFMGALQGLDLSECSKDTPPFDFKPAPPLPYTDKRKTLPADDPVPPEPKPTPPAPAPKPPKPKPAPPQPHDGKSSGRKKIILIAAAAVAVIGIALLIVISAGKNAAPSDTHTEDWAYEPYNNFEFVLNDVTYSLPMTYAELNAAGWEAETLADLQTTLKPGSTASATLINAYGSMHALFFNPSGDIKPLIDCALYGVMFGDYSLNENYLNETVNRVSTPDGLALGQEITPSEMKKHFLGKYKLDDGDYEIHVGNGEDTCCYVLRLRDSELTYFTIENKVPPEDFVFTYQTEAPAYDEAAFSELVDGVNDYTVTSSTTGVQYKVAVPLSAYLSQGWIIEKGPEYLISLDIGRVHIRKDLRTTQILDIVNPFSYAVSVDCCIVRSVDITPDEGSNEVLVLTSDTRYPSLRISTGIPEEEARQQLEASGVENTEYLPDAVYPIRISKDSSLEPSIQISTNISNVDGFKLTVGNRLYYTLLNETAPTS